MSWKGDLLKAGISSDGVDVELFKGGLACSVDDSNAAALKTFAYSVSLDDDAYYDLPAAKNGFAIVTNGAEGGVASVLADGSVTILAGSANFVGTDSDTDLCIFDNGTYARVRNRLGSTQTVYILFLYF